MGLEYCPKCDHKSLRFRAIDNNYICNYCKALFDTEFNEIIIEGANNLRLSTDENGNYYSTETKKVDNKIIFSKIYYLKKGKTTLEGDHAKLKKDSECRYPERLDCNSGIGYDRCEFMKYGGSLGYWICKYKR